MHYKINNTILTPYYLLYFNKFSSKQYYHCALFIIFGNIIFSNKIKIYIFFLAAFSSFFRPVMTYYILALYIKVPISLSVL